MGQNMVGWVRLKVEGPAGTTVTLRHAEVLDKQGNFYIENLRAAKQTVRYTLQGRRRRDLRAALHVPGIPLRRGRRLPGPADARQPDRRRRALRHDARRARSRRRSPLVNQLQHNIVWGQKGNFVDVPTDCPQRDERLGWMGDAQVFARTAAFNMDVAGFFTKWLRDVAADQLETGSVPHVIPDVLSEPGQPQAGSAAWADAAVIIPWTMYLSYGDRRILETQYPSMVAWVEYMRRRAGDDFIWSEDFTFGDWLAFASTASDYPGRHDGQGPDRHRVLRPLDGPACSGPRACSARRTTRRSTARCSSRIKAAFQREFVTATGRVGENTQTAYALALQFDLLPEALRAAAAAQARARGAAAQAPDDRLRRHAVPVPRAEPLRLPRRGLPAAQPRGVPVVALPGEAGRHDDLGALGRPEAGRLVPGQGHELVQPLRLRRDRRVDVPRHGRHRDRPGGARLQAHAHPAAARRRVHQREGLPRDAVRPREFGLDDSTASRSSWPSRCRPTPPRRCACPARGSRSVTEGGRPLAAGNGIARRARMAAPSSWRRARARTASPTRLAK